MNPDEIKRLLEDYHFKPRAPAVKLAQLAKLEVNGGARPPSLLCKL